MIYGALKAGGMALILFCTTSIGLAMARGLSSRVEELETVIMMLTAFSGELSYSLAPPDESVGRLEQRDSLEKAVFLPLCASLCRQGIPFPEAWRRAVELRPGNLSADDVRILEGLADTLGQCDLETQLSQLKNTKDQLSLQLDHARSRCQGYAKLYRMMGLLGGAFLVIILI